VCGKGEYSEGNVASPESRLLSAQIPQTPEELLRLVEEFFTNTNVNGYEFGEKVLGLHRTNWGPVCSKMKGFGENRDIRYVEFYPSRSGVVPLPVPYTVEAIKIDAQGKLLDLILRFQKNSKFLLTPAAAQKILGPPSTIYVTSPRSEFSMGHYYLDYNYRIEVSKVSEVYELEISFLQESERMILESDKDRKLREENWRHTKQQIKQERRWRKSFENHKDFLPVYMRLAREF
jgi:hypothetical protein